MVCQIGGYWFYFGGTTAEKYSLPEKYEEAVPKETIIQEIYDVLEDFKESKEYGNEYADEYAYYEAILTENNITNEPHTAEQAIYHLQHLRDNFNAKDGEKNVWYLDMAIKFLKTEDIIKELMEQNEENFDCFKSKEYKNCAAGARDYDKGYAEGIHDGLLDVLKKLGIETDEKYNND